MLDRLQLRSIATDKLDRLELVNFFDKINEKIANNFKLFYNQFKLKFYIIIIIKNEHFKISLQKFAFLRFFFL